jgi:hypothetical protein
MVIFVYILYFVISSDKKKECRVYIYIYLYIDKEVGWLFSRPPPQLFKIRFVYSADLRKLISLEFPVQACII